MKREFAKMNPKMKVVAMYNHHKIQTKQSTLLPTGDRLLFGIVQK
jgi:hypothetical protein